MTEWLVEGLIPRGAIVAIADLDDPPPEALIERGNDVVLHLAARGRAVAGSEVLLTTYFHERLGLTPPEPFLVRFDPEAGPQAVQLTTKEER